MQSKKLLAPLAVIAVSAIALSACGSSSSSKKTTGTPTSAAPAVSSAALAAVDKLTIGQEQAPTNFNNLQLDANAAETTILEEGVLPQAYRGQLDVTLGYDKDLLASEPMLTSQSPETVVYQINPKAVWSDGVPIDASDFIYNWKSQNGVDTKYTSAAGGTGYGNIKSVVGSGTANQTVTVVFSTPYADYQTLFGPLLPAHILAPDDKTGAFNTKMDEDNFNAGMSKGIALGAGAPFSGGPYIQTAYDPMQSLTLSVNPKWWGAPPKVKTLVFRFIEDTTQFPTALQNGELDIVNPQPTADEVSKTKAVTRLTSALYDQLVFEHIDYNYKNSFLADPNVRKAISTAVDVKGVIAGTVGQFAPDTKPLGNRLILNNQKGYVDDSGTYGKGDAAGAGKLLEASGYAKSGAYYAKAGKTLEISITCKNGNPLRVQEEQLMQAQLMAAGIKLDIKNTDKGIGEFTSAGDYDIALFAWVGGPALSGNTAIYTTAPKGGSSNTQGLSDPMVDSMLKAADGNFDSASRIGQENAVDKLLWDDAATLPLFQKAGFLAYPATIGNIQANPTQDGYTYNVADWGKKSS